MIAPKDRAELLELMAVSDCGGPDEFDDIGYELRRAYREAAIRILDAIEAAGCAVVPVEPTERMVERLRVSMNAVGGTLQNDLAVTVAASPYRKEQP